jgi:hypothetical protein
MRKSTAGCGTPPSPRPIDISIVAFSHAGDPFSAAVSIAIIHSLSSTSASTRSLLLLLLLIIILIHSVIVTLVDTWLCFCSTHTYLAVILLI